ncbi:MAG: hypothetical protein EBW82_02890, partial [Verrucomicrobia bacterium]|nr:hypothetical protein [Verrucomicrobiota bacterium]
MEVKQTHQATKGSPLRWILGGGAVLLVIIGVALAAFLPVWVVQWLGGKDFQRLASQQVSSLLQTEGDFQPLEWSSFSVYTPGFKSRPGAVGPWIWDFQDIRTEISPRLLLDRILRFSEITIGRLAIESGSNASIPREASATPASREGSSAELFRDVQVGKIEIRDFQITPSSGTSGWGAKGIFAQIKPSKQKTDFTFQHGFIQTPLNWLGEVSLVEAKGRYVEPTLFLTELSLKGKSGGSMDMSGEITPGTTPQAKGRVSWEKWPIPGGKIGVGLFEIPASMSGEFILQEFRKDGPVGKGQVRLVDARLEPGKGSETVLGLLGLLTGEPRLRGCPLTTAKATWFMQPNAYDVTEIVAEAPGLLRAVGQIQIRGQGLSGRIELGLEGDLGRKVNALTGGECFSRLENGYSVQAIQISGTMDSPRNDLQPKLT